MRHFESDASERFKNAVLPLKLEGVVAKRVDSVYRQGVPSSDWVKVKRRDAIPPAANHDGLPYKSVQRSAEFNTSMPLD